MELVDAIKGRRSIRKYTGEPVAREVIEEILEEAVWAPSGQNLQPWYFLALTQKEELHELFDILGTSAFSHRKKLEKRFANNPEVVEETMEFSREMGGAPCIILAFLLKPTYSDDDLPSCIESVAAAMQDICLLAYDKGLGTCWIEEVVREREKIETRFAPDKGRLLGAVILGHPAQESHPIKRKPGRYDIR